MTNRRRVGSVLLALVVLVLACGGAGIVGCRTGCEVLATKYTLTADCLEDGAESKETCTIEQTECTIVMTCGDALQHCRGYMTGTSINLSCTLANQRNAQVLADPKDDGYQLLFVQANACKAQMTPAP
ncbi:MAG: hypothetical protein EP343_30270 [Deltaproteobacteria bacterium]|nr:MAG: hypothetical protein EP343_30270 [Deltaproteobacteria bacterium]